MLDAFIAQNCIASPGSVTPLADFVGAYRVHCVRSGLPAPARFEVVAELERAGYSIGRHNDRAHLLNLAFARPPLRVENGRIVRT